MALLIMQDGTTFEGFRFGANEPALGEVIFYTGALGYDTLLTDGASAGQIIVLSYPIVNDFSLPEALGQLMPKGIIVAEWNEAGDVGTGDMLSTRMEREKLPGLYGVDTRQLTRYIRTHPVQQGYICDEHLDIRKRREVFEWGMHAGREVKEPVGMDLRGGGANIAIIDVGMNRKTPELFAEHGCHVRTVHLSVLSGEEQLNDVDGLVIAGAYEQGMYNETLSKLLERAIGNLPVMGIGGGMNLLLQSCGCAVKRLKTPHLGCNFPVKDLTNGQIFITTQHRLYSVDEASLPKGFELTHRNMTDGAVEGVYDASRYLMGIGFYPGALPSRNMSAHAVSGFLKLVKEGRENA